MMKFTSEFRKELPRICTPGLQVVVTLFFCCFFFFGCDRGKVEITPEHRLGAVFLSRSDISDIKMFKDQTYIHGLSFFYFRLPAGDVGRVVTWLRMTERGSIPPLLSDQVLSAATTTDWKFKWSNPKIYVASYCHPFDGSYSNVDLLLVNEGEAVFVTEGYLQPGSYPTIDASSCETPPQGPLSSAPVKR
jgi:hypothetical protein